MNSHADDQSKLTFGQRCRELLWTAHSPGNAVGAAALVANAFLAAVIIAALIFRGIGISTATSDANGIAADGAIYAGTLFGFLQAVTIFAVQFRSDRNGSILALTPLIARRYHSYFVLALAAGVAFGNLVALGVSSITPLDHETKTALSVVNAIALPGATLIGLFYLCQIVSHVGHPDIEVSKNVLRVTFRSQLRGIAKASMKPSHRKRAVEANSEVYQIISQIGSSISELSRQGRHIELKERVGEYAEILGIWLEVFSEDSDLSRVDLLDFDLRPRGPLDIDLGPSVRSVVLSDDQEAIRAFIKGMVKCAKICAAREEPGHTDKFLDALIYLYYESLRDKTYRDVAEDELDKSIYLLRSSRQITGSDKDDDTAISPVTTRIIRYGLELLYAAVHYNRPKAATDFLKRLLEDDTPRNRTTLRPTPWKWSEPSHLVDYIAIAMIGWSLRVLTEDKGQNDAALRTIDFCRAKLPSPRELLQIWEHLNCVFRSERIIDQRLEIDRWDIRRRTTGQRIGETWSGWGGRDWVEVGLIASLLLTESRHSTLARTLLSVPPREGLWDETTWQQLECFRGLLESLKVDAIELNRRLDEAASLIASRNRAAKEHALKEILSAPFQQNQLDLIANGVVIGYSSHNDWASMLSSLKVRSVQPDENSPPTSPIERRTVIPRELVCTGRESVTDAGEQIGRDLGWYEACTLINSVDEQVQRKIDLDRLDKLRSTVVNARESMKADGLQPDILVVPRENRIAGSLFEEPLIDVDGYQEFGDATFGRWESLLVIRCPYVGPTSIFLIDSQRAFRQPVSDPASTLKVRVDKKADVAIQSRRRAEEALKDDTAEIPTPFSIKDVLCVSMEPAVVMADSNACLRIELAGSDAMFVLPHGTNHYHRSGCSEIDPNVQIERILTIPEDSDRQSCATCRPDEWDFDGHEGKLNRN